MSGLSLYEIEDTLAAWQNSLDLAETDEQRLEIQARVAEYLQAATDKRDRFAQFLAHLTGLQALAKAESRRLSDRAGAIAATIDRLEQYAVKTILDLGLDRLEGKTATLIAKRNPPSVDITDALLVPIEYCDVTIQVSGADWLKIKDTIEPHLPTAAKIATSAPKKAAIKDAIVKQKKSVPGADLEMTNYRLEVK